MFNRKNIRIKKNDPLWKNTIFEDITKTNEFLTTTNLHLSPTPKYITSTINTTTYITTTIIMINY